MKPVRIAPITNNPPLGQTILTPRQGIHQPALGGNAYMEDRRVPPGHHKQSKSSLSYISTQGGNDLQQYFQMQYANAQQLQMMTPIKQYSQDN